MQWRLERYFHHFDSSFHIRSLCPCLPIQLFKIAIAKFRSIWKAEEPSPTMSYPVETILSREYKDPDKLEKSLNKHLGKDGWGELKASHV